MFDIGVNAIVGLADRWLMYTPARIVSSRLWGRFIPHSVPHTQKNTGADRYVLLPDSGGEIAFEGIVLRALPAHFLHSVGNFHFYDPVSRTLFSGDLGAGMTKLPYGPVTDFDAYVGCMEGFHRRYMASNAALRVWLSQIESLEIARIVPQHGNYFEGVAIRRLIEWLYELRCGIDLMLAPGRFMPT